MSALESIARLPASAIETANIMLTADDARIGTAPRDVIWTHRKTTLYRYRSNKRKHPVPVLLVFALINRADIFDLRPGHSFVEYLLDEGFDVYLLDWGVPDDEDGETGLDYYVCDALPWGMREAQRSSGSDDVSLVGWCIGGALCAMHAGIEGADSPARNLVLLTTPIDTSDSLYTSWVGRESFDVDFIADNWPTVPGRAVDFANKLMKPVTNFWTTNRRLAQGVHDGTANREAHQAMAKWVADNPPFPGRAFREWVTLDVQAEPARARPHAPARRARGPRAHRAEPARGHRRRRPHHASGPTRCRSSTWCAARTSPTSTALAATSA